MGKPNTMLSTANKIVIGVYQHYCVHSIPVVLQCKTVELVDPAVEGQDMEALDTSQDLFQIVVSPA